MRDWFKKVEFHGHLLLPIWYCFLVSTCTGWQFCYHIAYLECIWCNVHGFGKNFVMLIQTNLSSLYGTVFVFEIFDKSRYLFLLQWEKNERKWGESIQIVVANENDMFMKGEWVNLPWVFIYVSKCQLWAKGEKIITFDLIASHLIKHCACQIPLLDWFCFLFLS